MGLWNAVLKDVYQQQYLQVSHNQPVGDWTLGLLIAGIGCELGHMFPVFFGLRGGKGILSGGVLEFFASLSVAMIALYLAAPRTDLTFYLFAAGLGFTWLATVPPTAAIVGKLFGVRYLGTLFGLTLLSHQIGGFLGAWLGGLAITRFGDYSWMWYADMVLAGLAALVNLPIREARVIRTQHA